MRLDDFCSAPYSLRGINRQIEKWGVKKIMTSSAFSLVKLCVAPHFEISHF